MQLPRMIRVRQRFDRPIVADVAAEVQAQLARLSLERRVRRGQTVAITAGSRGIANIAEITRAIVSHCRDLGLQPFIVPAMGSHGGATTSSPEMIGASSPGVPAGFAGGVDSGNSSI